MLDGSTEIMIILTSTIACIDCTHEIYLMNLHSGLSIIIC